MTKLNWAKERWRLYSVWLTENILLEAILSDSSRSPIPDTHWEEKARWSWRISIFHEGDLCWQDSPNNKDESTLVKTQEKVEDRVRTRLERHLRVLLDEAEEEVGRLTKSLKVLKEIGERQ